MVFHDWAHIELNAYRQGLTSLREGIQANQSE